MDRLWAYAFVNWFLAYADGVLTQDEVEAVTQNVESAAIGLGHNPGHGQKLAREVRAALEREEDEAPAAFREALDALRTGFESDSVVLKGVRGALLAVAHADGNMDPMESAIVDAVVQRWHVKQA